MTLRILITGSRDYDDTHDCGDPRSWEVPYVGCSDLRSLAQPFRDHPDFDPAWTEET